MLARPSSRLVYPAVFPYFAIAFHAVCLDTPSELVDDASLPCCEVTVDDVLSGISHKAEIESQIVDGGNLHGQQLARFEQVVQVSLGVHLV